MTPAEKVAYLKGLIEGMGVDGETKEGKLFTVIADILEDLALDLEDTQETVDDLSEEVDDIADELDELEDYMFDDDECEDDDDDDECCCGHHHHHSHDDECCCEDDEDEEPVFYEVTCPACENTITVDEDVLLMGTIECPNCGETLEFDIEEVEDEDEEAPEDDE